MVKRGNLVKDAASLITGAVAAPGTKFLENPLDPKYFLKLPVELLYRTRWLAPVDYTFRVRDWGVRDYDYRVIIVAWYNNLGAGATIDGIKCDGPGGKWKIHAKSDSRGLTQVADVDIAVDELTMKADMTLKEESVHYVYTAGQRNVYLTCNTILKGRLSVYEQLTPYLDMDTETGTLVAQCRDSTGHRVPFHQTMPYSGFLVAEIGNFCSAPAE